MIRDDIKGAMKDAMKAKDTAALGALRLMISAINDNDIERRGSEAAAGDDDALVIEVLKRMIKQRRDSIALYEKGDREDLAEKERGELAVIERFLPRQMSGEETEAAVREAIAAVGASEPKDMGRVMAELRARHADTMDMGRASALAKAALAS